MKRTEIRAIIKEYIAENKLTVLSEEAAEELARYLMERAPDEALGNTYKVKCEFWAFFAEGGRISGRIDRIDPIETDNVIDSVSFSVGKDLRVMTWERDPFALILNMNDLSEDDITDIMHIDNTQRIDIYSTFMHLPEKDRGKLSAMIPDSMALELLYDDIPPYAFYRYDGLFYHTTNRGVGNFGGGIGFGAFVREKGTIVEIGYNVASIGEHAFDGCVNLTEVHIHGNVHYVGKRAFSNIPGLVIYCDAPSRPALWDDEWCDGSCKAFFKK